MIFIPETSGCPNLAVNPSKRRKRQKRRKRRKRRKRKKIHIPILHFLSSKVRRSQVRGPGGQRLRGVYAADRPQSRPCQEAGTVLLFFIEAPRVHFSQAR